MNINKPTTTTTPPIYLISGDDILLVDEAKQAVYQTALQHGFNHREILHIENSSSAVWQEFITLAYNLPLFATKQIIELRFNQNKPGNTGVKLLGEYLQKPSQDNILLLIMPKLDGSTKKSKWFKDIEQKGQVIQVWPLKGKQLPLWINNRGKQLGIKLDYNSANIIAEYSHGNLLAAKQTLEKLSLLYGNATINHEQLIRSLNDNAQFTSFDLIDAIYEEKNILKINRILEYLKSEDYAPNLILWNITNEIRLLINNKAAQSNVLLHNSQLTKGNYRINPEKKTPNDTATRQIIAVTFRKYVVSCQ